VLQGASIFWRPNATFCNCPPKLHFVFVFLDGYASLLFQKPIHAAAMQSFQNSSNRCRSDRHGEQPNATPRTTATKIGRMKNDEIGPGLANSAS
jgi:hypothetical protein